MLLAVLRGGIKLDGKSIFLAGLYVGLGALGSDVATCVSSGSFGGGGGRWNGGGGIGRGPDGLPLSKSVPGRAFDNALAESKGTLVYGCLDMGISIILPSVGYGRDPCGFACGTLRLAKRSTSSSVERGLVDMLLLMGLEGEPCILSGLG